MFNDCEDRVIHIDDKGNETIYTKEQFFDNEHCRYATDQNPENCPMINDWCDENNVGGAAESEDEDEECEFCDGCDDPISICEGSAHPCYHCDNGCGKVIAEADLYYQRVCDDCIDENNVGGAAESEDEDEDEKTYKCSDCDEWVTATEECCGGPDSLQRVEYEIEFGDMIDDDVMRSWTDSYGFLTNATLEYEKLVAEKHYDFVNLYERQGGSTTDLIDSWNKKDDKKDCSHKWECGCEKSVCEGCQEEPDDFCGCDECKNYYTHRNDNCRCGGRDCPYCLAR